MFSVKFFPSPYFFFVPLYLVDLSKTAAVKLVHRNEAWNNEKLHSPGCLVTNSALVKAFHFFTAFMARKTFDLRSTLKRNIYPENECRGKLSEPLSKWSITWDRFSHIHCGASGELFSGNLLPPLIRINHFINEHTDFRRCFIFRVIQVFN